jgi:hypothetical protein
VAAGATGRGTLLLPDACTAAAPFTLGVACAVTLKVTGFPWVSAASKSAWDTRAVRVQALEAPGLS